MSGAISTKTLAKIIEADLLREPSERFNGAARCLTCGRPHLYKGANGDDSGRFCSRRERYTERLLSPCRDGFDAGAPTWDESKEKNLHLWTPQLQGWRTLAGPAGTVGCNPWQAVIDSSERKRRKLEQRKNRKNKAARSRAYKGVIYE